MNGSRESKVADRGRPGAAVTVPVPYIDLASQRDRIAERLNVAISDVLASCQFTSGYKIEALETELARWSRVGHVVTCSSGTDALMLVLMAMGVGSGDAVFCPAFTFTATAEVIVRVGATPVFVDIDSATFNMEPNSFARGIETARRLGLKPKGAIPVDLFGQPADYDALRSVAETDGVWLLADAAQSFGSARGDVNVGALAHATATSFYPTKPLGCYGDGGAVFTDDAAMATLLRSLREHGKGADASNAEHVGLTARLDAMQAAVLLEKLMILDDELDARRKVAGRYSEALRDLVRVPIVREGVRPNWAIYTIRVPEARRDKIVDRLTQLGVGTAIYYKRPLHLQSVYRRYPTAGGGLDHSELAAREVLSLPIHPYLSDAAQDHVVNSVKMAFREA